MNKVDKLVKDSGDAANKEFCEHFLPDLSKQYPASWRELCRVCFVEGAKFGAAEALKDASKFFIDALKDKIQDQILINEISKHGAPEA